MEGSGNAVFHDRKLATSGSAMRTKRCLRARGIHDLATRQQLLSASLLSCRRSTTSSSNSAGRHGHDMVIEKLERKRWKMMATGGTDLSKSRPEKRPLVSDNDGLSSTHGSRIDRHPLQLVTRYSFGQVTMTDTNGTIHPDEKITSHCTFNKLLSRFSSQMPPCLPCPNAGLLFQVKNFPGHDLR